jgi:hypothetical protein
MMACDGEIEQEEENSSSDKVSATKEVRMGG